MKADEIDNDVTYGTKSGRKFLAFFLTFLLSGLGVIIYFDTYFTDFWKIKNCRITGYELNEFMTSCKALEVDRYAFGAIYSGVQKEAVKNAQNADVIIFGNSRTMRSFSAPSLDKMFRDKGLSYMVLASEGAGYKSAVLTTEKLKLKPKILMVNNEIHYFDSISDGFREIVDFPEKYETRFRFFHNAQRVQKWVCGSGFKSLQSFYCSGRKSSIWRKTDTGQINYLIVGADIRQKPIVPPRQERIFKREHVNHARELFGLENFKNTCRVLYLVNNPSAAPKLMDRVAEGIGAHAVYTDMEGLLTYDNSHMDRINSEKWAKEFVKELGPVLDQCIHDPSPTSPEHVDLSVPDEDEGPRPDNEFEFWNTRLEMTLTNKAALAPDGTQSADIMAWTKRGSRLYTTFPDVPVQAGTHFRYSAWLWADEETPLTMTAVKACGRETPPEAARLSIKATPEPQKFTLEHTFEHDHNCVLVQFTGLSETGTVNIWNGLAEYGPPDAEK